VPDSAALLGLHDAFAPPTPRARDPEVIGFATIVSTRAMMTASRLVMSRSAS
jgi:hypothetical protein